MATPSAGPLGRFPWRPRGSDFLGIVTLFILSRLLLVLVGTGAWGHQVAESNWRGIDKTGIRYALVPDQPLIDMWTRWDSWEYAEIAEKGYWYDFDFKPRPYGTVACFPFYPLMIRAVGMIMGGRYVHAGLLIANLSALTGMVLLFQWATWWGDRRSAWVVVSMALAFPAGLFWSALYPQSLFFALSIVSLALMLDGRVIAACLVGAAATATRLEALALLPALAAIMIDPQTRREPPGRKLLWVAIVPLGLILYMGYLAWGWGDPLLFMRVHALFGRGMSNPIMTLFRPLTEKDGIYVDGVVTTYFVGAYLILGHLARLRRPILLYGWLIYLIPLCSGVFVSIYRVHLVNFPIYLALGLGLRGWWRILAFGIIAVSALYEASMMQGWVIGFFHP